MLDTAREKGYSSCYLGNLCFNSTVKFSDDGMHYQTTTAARHCSVAKPCGYRQVRQLDLSELEPGYKHSIVVYQVNGNWRFVTQPCSGIATDVKFTIPDEYFQMESSERSLRWQWCRTIPQTLGTEIPTLFNVPDDQWLLYPDDVEQVISEAHLAGEISVKIAIGVREFLISFKPDSIYAQQLDPVANKIRFVRRCPMTAEEIDTHSQQTLTIGDASQTCAICLDTFLSTPHAPVIELPCGHTYHGMCIQGVADMDRPCCYCRADVDWGEVMSNHGGTVGSYNENLSNR